MIDETHQYGLNFASRISMADPNLLHRDIASLVHVEMDTYTHYIPALEREFVRLLAVFFPSCPTIPYNTDSVPTSPAVGAHFRTFMNS